MCIERYVYCKIVYYKLLFRNNLKYYNSTIANQYLEQLDNTPYYNIPISKYLEQNFVDKLINKCKKIQSSPQTFSNTNQSSFTSASTIPLPQAQTPIITTISLQNTAPIQKKNMSVEIPEISLSPTIISNPLDGPKTSNINSTSSNTLKPPNRTYHQIPSPSVTTRSMDNTVKYQRSQTPPLSATVSSQKNNTPMPVCSPNVVPKYVELPYPGNNNNQSQYIISQTTYNQYDVPPPINTNVQGDNRITSGSFIITSPTNQYNHLSPINRGSDMSSNIKASPFIITSPANSQSPHYPCPPMYLGSPYIMQPQMNVFNQSMGQYPVNMVQSTVPMISIVTNSPHRSNRSDSSSSQSFPTTPIIKPEQKTPGRVVEIRRRSSVDSACSDLNLPSDFLNDDE